VLAGPELDVGVESAEEIVAVGGGGQDTANLYAASAAATYFGRQKTGLVIQSGGGARTKATSFDHTIFHGDADDVAKLFDMVGTANVLTARPGDVTLEGNNITHHVMNTSDVLVFASNDPGDLAEMWDLPGQFDSFTSRMRNLPTNPEDPDDPNWQAVVPTARMQGPGYSHFTKNFRAVEAHSSGDLTVNSETGQLEDSDKAILIGLPGHEGRDVYTATPEQGTLESEAVVLDNEASHLPPVRWVHTVDTMFPRIHAVAKSGESDLANLSGTVAGRDRFLGTHSYGRLTGKHDVDGDGDEEAFFHRAVRFDKLYAYGEGGDDVADLVGSKFNDTFEGALLSGESGSMARQYNGKMDQTIHDFHNVTVQGGGGSDTAQLTYGSNDTVDPPPPLPDNPGPVTAENAIYSIVVDGYAAVEPVIRETEVSPLLSTSSANSVASGDTVEHSLESSDDLLALLAYDVQMAQSAWLTTVDQDQAAVDSVLETEMLWTA
jgi:hypothetical protein